MVNTWDKELLSSHYFIGGGLVDVLTRIPTKSNWREGEEFGDDRC